VTGDLKEIREGLIGRASDVCRQLLPHGRMDGGQWCSSNPRIAGDDRKTPALKVRLSGGAVGAWTDWRNGRDGQAGDIIGLVAYLNGTDTKGALAWARDFLGLKAMTRAEREAMRFAAQARAKKQSEDAEKLRAKKLLSADRKFSLAAPIGAGSPAETLARAYFTARRCPLEAVKTLNTLSFRFAAQSEWWKGAKWERLLTGGHFKAEDGPIFPAIHSAMRQATGIVTACHCTFLDPVKPAKAPVEPAKLMLGEAKGAVIEIAMGPSGKPFWQADIDGLAPSPVSLVEGIETGTSIAGEISGESRVWACGSLSGFAHAPVWLDCVSEIVVWRDNNHGNPQARKQFDAALEELERWGKRVSVLASHVGDDFNDLM
jgi:hypothetical protein